MRDGTSIVVTTVYYDVDICLLLMFVGRKGQGSIIQGQSGLVVIQV
jgi:hypothetical protein